MSSSDSTARTAAAARATPQLLPEAFAHPAGAGDARPTAIQVIELLQVDRSLYKDAVVLITGASSGIGVETARAFATLGCELYLPVRDRAKAEAVVKDIESTSDVQPGRIHLLELDLNSLASVRKCAEQFLAKSNKLNVLILNAGIMATPEGKTADGFELQFGTNHLAHFLLTQLLLPTLQASASEKLPSRVVSLSSGGHIFSPILFGDYDLKKRGYERWVAYGQAKTANIYLALEVERRFGSKGVHALAVHPGVITTGLQQYMQAQPITPDEMKALGWTPERLALMGVTRKIPAQGAATSVWAALHPSFHKQGGLYLEDCSVSQPKAEDSDAPAGYRAWAYDAAAAERLWDESIKMVGL